MYCQRYARNTVSRIECCSAGVKLRSQLSAAALPTYRDPPADRAELAAMLRLQPEDLVDDAQAVSCGLQFLFVPVRDRAALARSGIDALRWEAILGGYSTQQVFIFCRDPELPGSSIRARMYAPLFGIAEDPATGSAAAALGGYLGARAPESDGTLRWVVEQGFEMGRPSLLHIEIEKAGGPEAFIRHHQPKLDDAAIKRAAAEMSERIERFKKALPALAGIVAVAFASEASAAAPEDMQAADMLEAESQRDLEATARALTDPAFAERWARQARELPGTLERFQGPHATLRQAFAERRQAILDATRDPQSVPSAVMGGMVRLFVTLALIELLSLAVKYV